MKILSQLSKRERMILSATLFVMVSSFVYNFFIEQLYKKYKNLNQELLTKRIKLERFLKLTRGKANIEKEYNKFIKNVRLMASDEEEMAAMLTQIENMARNSGVYIVDMKPQGAKDKGYYKQFNVEVKVESNISNLTQFIYGIISSEQVMKLEKLQINAKGGGVDLLVSSINIVKIAIPAVKIQ